MPLSVQLSSLRPAVQIFSEASKGGTVSLPESAYTAVIRACCLDGRADRAREVLEALKRADVRPRVRCVPIAAVAHVGPMSIPSVSALRTAISLRAQTTVLVAVTRSFSRRMSYETCLMDVYEHDIFDFLSPVALTKRQNVVLKKKHLTERMRRCWRRSRGSTGGCRTVWPSGGKRFRPRKTASRGSR